MTDMARVLEALMEKLGPELADRACVEILEVAAESYREGARDVYRLSGVSEERIARIIRVMCPSDTVQRVVSAGDAERKGRMS